MFGGLKKKLQEAISKVVVPKKEEIDQEIRKTEDQEARKEIREEVQELVTHERDTRETIEARKLVELEKKMDEIDVSIESKQETEEELVEKIEEQLEKKPKQSIEEVAREEFEKITHPIPAEPKEFRKFVETEKIIKEPEHGEAKKEAKILEKQIKSDISMEKLIKEIEEEQKALEKIGKADVKAEELPKGKIHIEKEKQEAKPKAILHEEHRKIEPSVLKLKEDEKYSIEKLLEEPEKAKEEKRGFLRGIVKRIAEKKLEEKDIREIVKNLQTAMLENDTALEVAEKICDDVQSSLLGKSVKRGEVEKVINDSLRRSMLEVMHQDRIDIEKLIAPRSEPLLVMFLGFNGTGKTTTLAKFADKFKKYNPILAAGDTFRAASIEQLEEHGRRLGVNVIRHNYGSDSAAVIFDARKHAKATGSKLVLADTAGRSHSNVNLMDELKKVVRVNSPDLKILVLDSMTGNDIYEQAKLFNEAVGVDGIILTKADVYDKGDAALSAAYTIKKPILFLGVGQEYADLKEFVPEEVVKNLLE